MGKTEEETQVYELTPVYHYWRPTILKPISLIAFLWFFVAVAAALPILFVYSQKNNGLGSVNGDLHYLWKYGPTAGFTFAAICWARLEYRYKQLMPWKNMQKGYASADRSILLDYISPLNINVLFKSMKHKDYMVALPVLGSFLFQIMVIASTGLFSSNAVNMDRSVTMNVSESFNSTALRTPAGFDTTGSQDAKAISYGMRYLNLSHPFGTTENHVFPRFEIRDPKYVAKTGGNSMKLDLDVLTFDMPCEPAKITLSPQKLAPVPGHGGVDQWASDITLITDSCTTTLEEWPLNTAFTLWDDFPLQLIDVPCTEGLYSVSVLVRHNGTEGTVTYINNDENGVENSYSGLLCTPRLNITTGQVSFKGIPGTANAMTNISFNGNGLASSRFQVNTSMFSEEMEIFNQPDVIFEAKDRVDPTPLKNMTHLANVLSRAYTNSGVQWAKQRFISEESRTSTGAIFYSEERLFLRPLSFGFIEGCTVLLGAMVVWMLWFTDATVCPRDPGSVGGVAAIIGQDASMKKNFEDFAGKDEDELSKNLSNTAYCTTIDRSDGYQGHLMLHQRGEIGQVVETAGETTEKEERWWRPLAALPTARILTIIFPAAVVVALEILYRKSASMNGIATVDNADKYQEYAWLYVPAMVMVMIQANFAAVAFSIRLFQPFVSMQHGQCYANDALLVDHLGKMSIHNLYGAVSHKRIAVAAISITRLLAPFLTIAISGLYTLQYTTETSPLRIQQWSVWSPQYDMNTGWVSNSFRNRAKWQVTNNADEYEDQVAEMVSFLNMSYPQWTYGNLVFPTLTLEKSDELRHRNTTGASTSLILPALRYNLNCTIVPDSLVKDGPSFTRDIVVDAALPVNCPKFDTLACATSSGGIGVRVPGAYFDCWGDHQTYYVTPQSHCPTIAYAFGQLGGHINVTDEVTILSQAQTVTAMICRPYIEEVDVLTSFTLPDLNIDFSKPPKPVSNTAKPLFDFYLGHEFSHVFQNLAEIPLNSTTSGLDSWMRAIMFGINGIAPQELLGKDNAQRYMDSMNGIMGLKVAQVINLRMRSATPIPVAVNETLHASVPTSLPVHDAELHYSGSARLVQSAISTRLVQGLLAAMILCAVIATWKQNTARVLPRNPCSIAAKASLLAGSRLMDPYCWPPGSQYWSDERLAKEVLGGTKYSMGWWRNPDGTWRFGIDVGMYDAKDRKGQEDVAEDQHLLERGGPRGSSPSPQHMYA